MKIKLTLALVATLTSTAFAEFKAPLPEFKNEKQLAEWRAEKASAPTGQVYKSEVTAFYTGKPYLAFSGDYVFKFRSYNPELARWTSEDPSRFPDGANQQCYINNSVPTSFDYLGLSKTVYKTIWQLNIPNYGYKSYASIAGYSIAGGAGATAAAACMTNPAGWAVGGLVGLGLTAGASYVYGQGLDENNTKARTAYPMWSDISGGSRDWSYEREAVTKSDDFDVRNYITGYDADGHFGGDGFDYSMPITFDHYELE